MPNTKFSYFTCLPPRQTQATYVEEQNVQNFFMPAPEKMPENGFFAKMAAKSISVSGFDFTGIYPVADLFKP